MQNIRITHDFIPYPGTEAWTQLVIAYNDVTNDVNALCEQGIDPSEALCALQEQLWNEIMSQLEADYGDDREVICNALNDSGVFIHSDPRKDPRDNAGVIPCPF